MILFNANITKVLIRLLVSAFVVEANPKDGFSCVKGKEKLILEKINSDLQLLNFDHIRAIYADATAIRNWYATYIVSED